MQARVKASCVPCVRVRVGRLKIEILLANKGKQVLSECGAQLLFNLG